MLRRLRWQCRRGMLELDLLLSGFLDGGWGALGEGERETFLRLLACEDQMLYEWFLGLAVPADEGLAHLVEKVRACAGALPGRAAPWARASRE